MKRMKGVFIALAALLVTGFGVAITAQAATCLSNDKANDIMECGFSSRSEFVQKAKANAPGDLDNIFSHYGLTPSEYDRFGSEAKAGKVSTNGNVTVDGKVIGTGAKSLGRKAKAKSSPVVIDGVTYHESNIGDVTTMDNDVTVLMDADGRAKIIIMNICGNPIRVTQKEQPAPAISIVKSVNNNRTNTIVNLNEEFNYQVTVKNTGNVDLKDVKVTDTPQEGITLVSSATGTITNNTWTHTIPTLAVGKEETFTLKAKVPAYKSGNLKNTACVDTPTIPGGPDGCSEVLIGVPEPRNVQVCDTTTGQVITVKESERNNPNYAPADSPKCADIKVCDLDTKTIVTIKKDVYESNKTRYTTDESKCQPAPTPTPPTTPTLPSTGPAETLASLFGLSSVAGAGYYWRASRRALIDRSLDA